MAGPAATYDEGKMRVGKHSSRRAKGTVAIVAGVAIALAGGATLVHGLTQDSTPDNPAGGSPTSAGSHSGGTAGNGPSSGSKHPSHSSSSSHGSSSGTASSATTVPKPKSNSKRVQVANPVGAACIPKSLTVKSVGIAGEHVVPMGTNSQGQIYPPAHTTMWYNRSTQPGQNGISVIAGHVTYDGPDNFYNLRNVPVGAKVSVVCTNDKVVKLRVTHKESVLKTKLTTDQRVWGGSATPVVTLVTCDIKSPMVSGHHLSNYVVWTKPA